MFAGNEDLLIIDVSELLIEPEVIGEGSFSKVKKATWRGEKVAVKQIKSFAGISEEDFLQEAKFLSHTVRNRENNIRL